MASSKEKDSFDYIFGTMSLIVVAYRLVFIMYPMASQAIKDDDYASFFKSLTLLV